MEHLDRKLPTQRKRLCFKNFFRKINLILIKKLNKLVPAMADDTLVTAVLVFPVWTGNGRIWASGADAMRMNVGAWNGFARSRHLIQVLYPLLLLLLLRLRLLLLLLRRWLLLLLLHYVR